MSLRSALQRLPHDRRTELAVREVLSLLTRHTREWMDAGTVSRRAGIDSDTSSMILGEFAHSLVLDFDDESNEYRYPGDRLTDLEIDRFMRRADSHSGLLQSNVEKFRRRYGDR